MSEPTLTSIEVAGRPVRLRRAYDKQNPDWRPEGLEVWTSANPNVTQAACVTGSSPTIWISIKWNGVLSAAAVRPSDNRVAVTLSWTVTDSEGAKIPSETGTWSFPRECKHSSLGLNFPGCSSTYDLPFGLKAKFAWSVQVGGQTYKLVTTPLELYRIVEELPSVYMNEAINVELLQGIVLSGSSKDLKTRESWINHIVDMCFYSKNDPLTTDPTKAMHSYRYDIINGASRFSNGRNYDLDAWAQNKDRPNNHIAVNCYDQAGITFLALSLLIPAKFRTVDGKEHPDESSEEDHAHEDFVANVGVLWKEPFGFIQRSDLIGWGLTDNPFFDPQDERTRDMKDGVLKDKNNENVFRSDFGNHKWVYVRKAATSNSVSNDITAFDTVDACAGPGHLQSLDQYFTDVIAQNSNKRYPNEKYTKSQPPQQGTGEYSTGSPHYVTAIRTAGMPFNDASYDYYHKRFGFASIVKTCDIKPTLKDTEMNPFTAKDWAKIGLEVVYPEFQRLNNTTTVKPVQAPVSQVFETIKNKIRDLKGQPSDTLLHPLEVGALSTQVVMDFWTSQSTLPYATVTIQVEKNFENAMIQVLGSLRRYEGYLRLRLLSEDDSRKCGQIHLARQSSNTSSGLVKMVYGNIAITIRGNLSQQDADSIITSLKPLLDTSPRDLKTVPINSGMVAWPSPAPAYNEPFTLIITAQDCAEIDIAFSEKNVVALQDPKRSSSSPNKWEIPCIVRDESSKSDKLHVVFAESTTYAASSIVPMNVTINP